MPEESARRFGRRRVAVSHLDKVLFPDAGITMGALLDYYVDVAEVMLPHVRDRPLALHRYPDGIAADGFLQQHRSEHFPDWLATATTPRAGGGEPVEHVLANSAAALAYLANQAVITFHGWLARTPRLSTPDRLIFDLDPPDDDFAGVRRAARDVIDLMEELGLNPYLMTTGSRGLHLVAPLRAEESFDQVRKLAQAMAAVLAERHPERLTTEQRKARRGRRIYLDVLRNAYGQTAVLPYAVRARPGAPVATPLALDELADPDLAPQRWHLQNIRRRLAQRADPWQHLQRHGTAPRTARRALEKLSS